MTDFEIAVALEIAITRTIKLHKRCDCKFLVIEKDPEKYWYKVRLQCRHTLVKFKPRDNMREPPPHSYGWFTVLGEPVPKYKLRAHGIGSGKNAKWERARWKRTVRLLWKNIWSKLTV